MHIIIDGYNLIRQSDVLRRFEKFGLEAGRRELLRKLSLYKKARRHKITVVFDGWMSGPLLEEREREGGITVVYSKRGEKADEVIKRMAHAGGEETLVVTSDREITETVSRWGASVVSGFIFESRMRDAETTQHSVPGFEKAEEGVQTHSGTKKKGPSRRLSRKNKAALTRIKKL
jgi:predicted RNA-binding protein with PIN domain